MKSFSTIFLVLVSFNFVHAQDSDTELSLQEAIASYRSGPMTDEGHEAGKLVLNFAEESDLVLIELSVEKAPWILDKTISEHLGPKMLLAYVVGNVDSQLEKGIQYDSHCAGIEEVSRLLLYLEAEEISNEILLPAQNSLKKAASTGGC